MNDSSDMAGQLILSYTNHQRVRGFSAATIRRREWTLRQLVAVGPLDEHTVDTVEAFLLRWPCPATRNALLSDIRGFYRWAVRRGHLEGNPAGDIEPSRVPVRAATPLNSDQVARVLAVANRDQRTAVMLGLYAGLRCAEIADLDCGDVDRQRMVLVVRDGKGGKDAVLPLARELAAVLPLRGPAVRYPTAPAVGRAIRRAYRAAGVVARPHDTRHTFGTAVARRSNGNMVLTATLLRHSSFTTSQRYIGWLPEGADVIDGLHAA